MVPFILIMILGGYSSQSGYAVIQQEFNSRTTCEQARTVIVAERQKSVTGVTFDTFPLRLSMCISKG